MSFHPIRSKAYSVSNLANGNIDHSFQGITISTFHTFKFDVKFTCIVDIHINALSVYSALKKSLSLDKTQ